MKKSLAIIIVLILIVLGVGVWWFYFGRGGEEGANGGTSGGEQGFIGKIADALKIGTAMKCSWSMGENSATFYIKGGKLRGDVIGAGQKVEYIMRDNCYYYWSEKEDEGVKWCWEPTEAPSWEESMQAAAETYNCQPATVSDSMFNTPSGVDFTDMSEYMQQYMPEE